MSAYDWISRCAAGFPIAAHRYYGGDSGGPLKHFRCSTTCDVPIHGNAGAALVAFMLMSVSEDKIDWPSAMRLANALEGPYERPGIRGIIDRLEVSTAQIKRRIVSALHRALSWIRDAARRYNPLRIIWLLEEIKGMQPQTADALNRLGSEVNSFTTDVGAFIAHSKGVIEEKTATITDLTAKLEAAIANGTDTVGAIADLKEATSDIDEQTDRLAAAHKSLTDFTIPPVAVDAAAPPVVTAPVVDPTADTIPPQPEPQPGDPVADAGSSTS